MRSLSIGTRGSKLAMWQAYHAAALLRAVEPGLQVDIQVISTKGDELRDTPLAKIGGKGLFTKELERALADGRVDVCVHSLKDVPSVFPNGLKLAGCLARADARDALVAPHSSSFDQLSAGARVGTGSLRRSAQLRYLRPDLDYVQVRGNVDTRVAKTQDGTLDALVLAAAGLDRMELAHNISQRFDPTEIVPAVGQGVIGLEIRADDAFTAELCAKISCFATDVCIAAERQVMVDLDGGCQAPLGAYARFEEGFLVLNSFVGSPDAQRVLQNRVESPLAFPLNAADVLEGKAQAKALASKAVEELVSLGAREILAKARDNLSEVCL